MNVLTEAMNQMYKGLKDTDSQFKKMATEPYGVRRATRGEQKRMLQGMTEDQMWDLVNKQGFDKVNRWLASLEDKE